MALTGGEGHLRVYARCTEGGGGALGLWERPSCKSHVRDFPVAQRISVPSVAWEDSDDHQINPMGLAQGGSRRRVFVARRHSELPCGGIGTPGRAGGSVESKSRCPCVLPWLRQSVPWTASGRPRISWPGTSFRPTSDSERVRSGIPWARPRDHTQRLAARCRTAEPLARPVLSAALPVSFHDHLRGRPALCNCMQGAAWISTAHRLHQLSWQGAVLPGGDLSGTDRSLG